jgi:PAS domain S-box-containing protein
LYEQQNILKTIISSTPDMFVLKDRNLVYQAVNNTFCEFLGKPKVEIIGKTDFDFFPKPEADICHREEVKVMETKNEQVVEIETDGKGGKKCFQIARTPVLGEGGNCTGILCTIRDITVPKEAEKNLKESEEKFRHLIESSPLGIHMYSLESDNRLVFIGANPAADDILGIDNKQFIGKTIEEAFPPLIHTEIPERYLKACTLCESWQTEQMDYEDEQIKGAFEVTAFQTSPGKMAAMFRDITKRKQAEDALHTYQKRLQSLASELSLTEERERRSIASDLHDYIGQSLAISKIKIKLLQKNRTSPDLLQPLEEILNLLDQAIKYTRSLMSELSPPMLYELGLEAALEWLVDQFKKKHGMLLSFNDDKCTKPLDVDIRMFLFKAVRELLINIVKHWQASNTKVWVQKNEDTIQIIVKDDGVGFDASKTGHHVEETGGFGLFNIQERLAYLGGSLEIKSKPGKGTSIILVAPLKRVETIPKNI